MNRNPVPLPSASRMKKSIISLSALSLLLAFPPSAFSKQSEAPAVPTVELKLRLLSEALISRDQGDYGKAKEQLEALLRLVGQDPQVLNLLKQVQLLALQPKQPRPPEPKPVILPDPYIEAAPALSTQGSLQTRDSTARTNGVAALAAEETFLGPPPPELPLTAANLDDLVQAETNRQTYYLEKARRDLWYVRRLADEGRHSEALQALASVAVELPSNPRTLPLLQEVSATKVDIEHRLRVAALSPGSEPPHLTLIKDDLSSVVKSTDPLSKRPLVIELHMLELSGDLIDDFWTAWRFFSETSLSRGPARIHQSILGRTNSLYKPGHNPTKRQHELLTAFRLAAPRIFNSTPLPEKDRSLGFVAFFDAGSIVRVLSSMKGCYVLGSPSWDTYPGQGAHLSLSPDKTERPTVEAQKGNIGWQIGILPQLAEGGRSVLLDLHPKLTRYAGFVPSSSGSSKGNASMLSPVYSTSELNTQLLSPLGATVILTGLEWQQTPTKAPPPGSLAHLPLIGDYLRANELMGERTELLIFVTIKAQQ